MAIGSTASSAGWSGNAATRWGHWGSTGLAGSVAAILALGIRPLPAGTPAAVLVPMAVLAFALASWLAMRQHDRRLCEICAAAVPLNASEIAARYHRRFAVAHAGSHRSLVVAYLVVLAGSDVVLLDGTANLIERICWSLIQSSMIYLVLAYSTHRRFQPWCPQCRGGDGRRDLVEGPGPVPLGSSPL
jgi:hypothetical protein